MRRRPSRFGNILDGKQCKIIIIIAYMLIVLPGCAHGISCNATYDPIRKTYVYSASEVTGGHEVKENNCKFSWSMDNKVLATEMGKDESVGHCNVTTLEFREFMDLHYRRSCISERVELETNCTSPSIGIHESQGREANRQHHYCPLAFLLFLVVVVVGILVHLCRNRKSRSEAPVTDEETAQCGRTGCYMWRGGK